MVEQWKKKTVSLNQVDKETFDAAIRTIKVAETGIFGDVPAESELTGNIDPRVQQAVHDFGRRNLVQEVYWEDVEDVATYPDQHVPFIAVIIRSRSDVLSTDFTIQKRIYFSPSNTDELERCYNAIHRYRNAWRQNMQQHPSNDHATSEPVPDAAPDEEVELAEALEQRAEQDRNSAEQDSTAIPADEQPADSQQPQQKQKLREAQEQADAEDTEEDADTAENDNEDDDDEDEDEDLDKIVDRFMEDD